MDSTVVGAIIGASATLLAVVLAWLLPKRQGKARAKPVDNPVPDKDSIYFMQFLLHDAYEKNEPMSSAQLAEHHLQYAPLEVEAKLATLQSLGYVQRINRIGPSKWQMTLAGVKFMIDNGHQLQDLIAEVRGA